MTETRDILDDFIVDENQPIDREILAKILNFYKCTIAKNEVIRYDDEKFEKLVAWKKVLVYLCCRKVMLIKGIIKEEGVGPTILAEGAKISLDAAKNISRNKSLSNLLNVSKGKYCIKNYQLNRIWRLLVENERDS